MRLQRYFEQHTTSLVIVFFLLVYILGANTNSSLDAWAYAAQVSQGRDLFQPHHLLYNLLGYIWVSSINLFIAADTLILLKILNAIFAASGLFVLSKILAQINPQSTKNFWLVVLTGSSWGVMRFATENEAYIVPIFFALLGTYFFVTDNKPNNIILSGFFVALSALFHQVMFFWWFGLLMSIVFRWKLKDFLLFSIPAIIVPLVYSVVVYLNSEIFSISALLHFVFSDYYSGSAGIDFGWKAILLLFINLIRSFIQVHGYILNLGYIFWIFGLVCFLIIGFASIKLVFSFKSAKIREKKLLWVISLTMLLHIVFASLSGGNAEFLVMIPVLLAITLSFFDGISKYAIGFFASGIFFWNLIIGTIPLKFLRLDDSEMVVNHIKNNEVKSVYILNNLPRIENELDYRQINSNHILIKSTALSSQVFRDSLNSLLLKGLDVYTDSYMIPFTISRDRIVRGGDSEYRLLDQYEKVPIDSMSTITGKYLLVKVESPSDLHPE